MTFLINTALIFGGLFELTIQTPMRGNNVRNTKDNEFPFIVSIGRKHELAKDNPEITHYCTGTLITRKHVLTASHCFVDELPHNTYVLYESPDLKSAQKYDVKEWITYNAWYYKKHKSEPFSSHDIAVVILKRKINDSNFKPVIPLIFPTPNLYGSYAIAAGWGRTENGSNSQVLRVVRFKIVSNDECIENIEELTDNDLYLHSRFFCSHSDPWALLDCGDSGGPLFRHNSLIGINLGSCPQNELVSHLPKDLLNKKQMNLHLGFHYYREFIRSATAHC